MAAHAAGGAGTLLGLGSPGRSHRTMCECGGADLRLPCFSQPCLEAPDVLLFVFPVFVPWFFKCLIGKPNTASRKPAVTEAGVSKFPDARTPGGLPGLYEYTALNGSSASKASGFPSRVQALHEQELGITGMRYFWISGVRDSSSFRILRKVN